MKLLVNQWYYIWAGLVLEINLNLIHKEKHRCFTSIHFLLLLWKKLNKIPRWTFNVSIRSDEKHCHFHKVANKKDKVTAYSEYKCSIMLQVIGWLEISILRCAAVRQKALDGVELVFACGRLHYFSIYRWEWGEDPQQIWSARLQTPTY